MAGLKSVKKIELDTDDNENDNDGNTIITMILYCNVFYLFITLNNYLYILNLQYIHNYLLE